MLAVGLGAFCPGPTAAAGLASSASSDAASAVSNTAAPDVDRARATFCLATAVYYEAANQSLLGRQAVAQVVLNRLRHPAYPKTVCGVVYQGASSPGCQFSFACDGALARSPEPHAWSDALELARSALQGLNPDVVGSATHYHTVWIRPGWSDALTRVGQVGDHVFYRYPGRSGLSSSLTGLYAGSEPWITPSTLLAGSVTKLVLHKPSAPAAPRLAAFSVWGLPVASARPLTGGEVSISLGPAS